VVVGPGSVIDRYEIGPEIGRGGMGRVYRARDARLDREVAVKVVEVADDEQMEEARRRLMREARAAAALDHPSAVSIFDVGEVDGVPYIVMELVPGQTLRSALASEAIDRDTRLRWLVEVARVLRAAHAKGLIHRDIKPENIMLRTDGTIRVLDFGIARRRRRPVDEAAPTESLVFATITEVGMPVGTPLYMSPEQIRGTEVDGRTDQFAWGVMAYEMLSGTPPWGAADSLQLVAAILTEEPEPLRVSAPGVDPRIASIIHRTLSKDAGGRFQETAQLVAALEAALGDVPSPTPAAPPQAPIVSTPPPPMGDLSGYSAPELSEILERALLAQPPTEEALEATDLIELTRRMGVREDILDAAAQDLSEVASPWARRQAKQRGFKVHAAIWAAVCVFLFLINMLTSPGTLWFLFPLLSWGLGLAIHGISVQFSGPTRPRRRKLRRLMKKLGGHRVRTGLTLEPAVRQVLHAAHASAPHAATLPASGNAPMGADPHVSWDARYAAHRIDSRLAKPGPRVAEPTSPTQAEAEAEAEAAEEALTPEQRAKR
jgi:eukaryotic-like serine/threonine-protein kinase